jgi:signal transduction histidine kinase
MSGLRAARTRREAVWSAVRFCSRSLGAPSAGWLREAAGHGYRMVASLGLSKDEQSALQALDGTASDADGVRRSADQTLTGALSVEVAGGDVVVLVSPGSDVETAVLDMVAQAVGLALDRLAIAEASRELSRSFDAGLGWTAHEVRAPLLGIEKAIARVIDRDALGERDRDFLERARDDLQRLSATVDDLLRWSVGMASMRYRRTDLADLIGETMKALSLGANDRAVSVDAPIGAVARVDPVLLRIAIENLVRNSLEHGGDHVQVSVSTTDHDATVTVCDDGSGIRAGERLAIFEPFVRGQDAGPGGRGLGLVIANRVVEAHGGKLWVEDAAPGSMFRMRIPLGGA